MSSKLDKKKSGSGRDDKKRPSDGTPKKGGASVPPGGSPSTFAGPDPNVISEKEMPDIAFIYAIDELELILEDKYGHRMIKGGPNVDSDVAAYWHPPNHKSGFVRKPGRLFRWTTHSTELVHESERSILKDLIRYSATSVCFQARQDNFLVAGVDCTVQDVKKESPGWCQITFHHHPNYLSEVDIAGGRSGLAAPAKNLPWMPQVLPAVYDYDFKSPRKAAQGIPTSGGLCGKLGILLGMAAFSSEVSRAEAAVQKCFRFGGWLRHDSEIGIGRYRDRGVVVRIYLDPKATDITEKHLKRLEDGHYGPIFTGSPVNYSFRSGSSTSAAMGHGSVPRSIPSGPSGSTAMYGGPSTVNYAVSYSTVGRGSQPSTRTVPGRETYPGQPPADGNDNDQDYQQGGQSNYRY